MEQASEFYDSKVKELQVVFEEVSICVGGVHDVHKDREKCSLVKVNSPCTSIHHLWSLAEEAIPIEGTESEVSAGLRKRYFAIWCLNAREKTSSQKTSLASFVNESFMLTLEENAIKDALREFLPMLVYIDRIRSFALLNCVTIMKLAQRHCNAETSKALIDTLYATPMFQMTAINILQPKIENLARKLQQQLTGTVAELPSSWSMHVCPFCSHTVTNGRLYRRYCLLSPHDQASGHQGAAPRACACVIPAPLFPIIAQRRSCTTHRQHCGRCYRKQGRPLSGHVVGTSLQQ
jgi:hypothetical protein